MQRVLEQATLLCLQRQIPQLSACVQLQTVRWRKPRWLPKAKSKIFKIPVHPIVPQNEKKEEAFLYADYQLYMGSFWQHFKSTTEEAQTREAEVNETEEFEKALLDNERENERVRGIREAARIEEWNALENEILMKKSGLEEDYQQKLKKTEGNIEAQLAKLKTAVKFEDLENHIEKILNEETDYNFAIDKNGNRFIGRYNTKVLTAKETLNLSNVNESASSFS